ncbi:MAG: TrmH family RNA methyltransferase [Christensenellales bacterium]
MKTINIGKDNATFQQILSLKENRNKRAQTKLFFVEGVQNIKDAIKNDWEIEAFIYSASTKLSSWAKSILNKANNIYVLAPALMKKLSDKDDISEILAIIKMKSQKTIAYSKNPILLLIDRPSKKGNLGTIFRSCDALNVEQIFYSGHSVDIYDHSVITASMGSFFKLPITFVSSNSEFVNIVNDLKSKFENLKVVATSLQTNNRLQDYDFTSPVLLLIGNETDGLCKFYNEQADDFVKISMRDGIDSLNIACATTACLYEINRQRNF